MDFGDIKINGGKYMNLRNWKPKKGKIVNCVICGHRIYLYPSRVGFAQNRYCSYACHNVGLKKGKEVKCKTCGKKHWRPPSYIKSSGNNFCSVKCMGIGNRGKENRSYKSCTSYKKALWTVFSKYIRLRDCGICISCGKVKHWKDMDAGHYVPKTAGLALYFNEQNVNAQCTYCNRWMHGNLSRYAIALRRKYGQNILEELDKKRQKIIQITIPEYQKHIETYRLKIKKLEAGLP